MPAAEALAAHGLEPITFAEKEGLALINGTDGMLGQLILALTDLDGLLELADIAAAMSVEGLLGTERVFAPHLQALRPQPGQAVAAANMMRVLAGSPIVASHSGPDCTLVQDAYSLRCAPQVAGAARDTATHARNVANWELASVIDNPVVTDEGTVESNGNFHGAPVAYVLDFLAIVVADLASISERRTDRFLDASRSHGLNPFLADDPGVDSGHMIAQYTQARDRLRAQATGRARQRRLDPVVGDAGGPCVHGLVRGPQTTKGDRRTDPGPCIEVLTAARGIDMRSPLQPSPATGAVIAAVRARVAGQAPDRYLAPEIESVTNSPATDHSSRRRSRLPAPSGD